MGTNEIDIALANLAQNNANKRYICEELLFFYALWEKKSIQTNGLPQDLAENKKMFGSCLEFAL